MNNSFLTKKQVKTVFKKRNKDCNKGDFGYVALVGGSLEYSGAIRLAALANCSARAGAGVVSVAVPKSLAFLIAENILECTIYPLSDDDISLVPFEMKKLCDRYKAIAIGMGMGLSDIAKARLIYLLLHYEGILIIDADGLNILSTLDTEIVLKTKAKLILTPHVKEFSRLSMQSIEEILEDPIASSLALSKKLNAVVLLKGSTTVIARNDEYYLVDRGCPGMATAGSGDVLSGVLLSIAANCEDLLLASAAASYICGLAGEIAEEENGEVCMLASDTARHIKDAILEITEDKNSD